MYDPAGIHLLGQSYHVTLHVVTQDLLLDLTTVLEELLNHVVSEHVLHELDGVGFDLPEDLILLVAVGRLQLLLNESRSILITTELDHMVVQVLESGVSWMNVWDERMK